MESGDIVPCIPDLVTKSRWMVSFTIWRLHQQQVNRLGILQPDWTMWQGNICAPAVTIPSYSHSFRHYRRSALSQTPLQLNTVNHCYIVRKKMGAPDTILDEITWKQLIWYGHVERTERTRLPKLWLTGNLKEGKNESVSEEPGKVGYTGFPGRNVPDFGRMSLKLKYTDITQNTYNQSWTVTEIMAREVWKYGSCYTLIDY